MRATPDGPALVGRDRELAALTAACRSGAGGLTLVEGEAGSGKTRLLDEVAAAVARAGVPVHRGHAVPAAGAFRPLAEALAGAADPALADRARIAPFRAVLARILPSWPAGPAAGAHLVDPVVVLGEALVELLDEIAGGERLVVVLDDLHWADRDTLAVLEYLAGRLGALPVRVLAATRSDERPPEGLAVLRRHPDVAVVEVGRLDAAQAGRLAAAVLGGSIDPAVRDHVLAAADGLPLLVEELCAGLVETGSLIRRDGCWSPAGPLVTTVPEAFADAVARRVAVLEPGDRELVHVAALLGRDLPFALLPAAAGVDDRAAAGALRRAVEARLLAAGPDGRLRWRHALAQDAVLADLTGPERAVLAARAADALDVDDLAGQHVALVASLHARGGDPARATELLLRHAREQRAAGALAASSSTLEQAAALAGGELRPTVAAERVEVLALSARTDDALAVGEHLLAGASGEPRTALAVALARACVAAERFDEADRLLELVAGESDARVAALSAHVALGRGEVAQAQRRADAAVAAYDAGPDGRVDVVCEALEAAGRARRRADPSGSREALRRAERLAAEHGLTAWRIRALSELGVNDLFGTGDGSSMRQAEDLARDAGMLGTATMLELQQTAFATGVEGPVAAMDRAQRCAEHAGRLGLSGLRGHALMFVARGRVFAGRAADAPALLDEAASLSANPVNIESARHLVRGYDAWLAAEPLVAAGEMDRCVDTLRAEGGNATPAWGERAVLRTALDPADPGPREELRTSDVLVQSINRAALHYCDAVAAAHDGRPDDAAREIGAAEALLVHRPFHRRLLRAFLLEGSVLGDPVPQLQETLAWLAGTGEERMARWCRERLRGLGAPVPRPGRDVTDVPSHLRARGVTGREMEVLRLAADGLGNPEIATRLRLSRRTVETHVANLLAKTGATDRGGLAGWLGEGDALSR